MSPMMFSAIKVHFVLYLIVFVCFCSLLWPLSAFWSKSLLLFLSSFYFLSKTSMDHAPPLVWVGASALKTWDDRICHIWTLTPFMSSLSQSSCCQDERRAGSPCSFEGEAEKTETQLDGEFAAADERPGPLRPTWGELCCMWSLFTPQRLSFSTCSPGYWDTSYSVTFVSILHLISVG